VVDTSADRYLDLLSCCLTRELFIDEEVRDVGGHGRRGAPLRALLRPLNHWGLRVVRTGGNREQRLVGLDWPTHAETMVGTKRLENLRSCVETVLADKVPGDLIETGVWRGGSVIFMKAVLAAHGDEDRVVWAADSFEGLPKPDAAAFGADAGDAHWRFSYLAVSLEQVRRNFERYGLLDDRVRFLPGWFKDTLPTAPIDALAVLRLDGDMYASTWDALTALYPKVSVGGFVVVDDYGLQDAGCAQAVDEFRRQQAIVDRMTSIDWSGVYWRRSR